MANERVEVVPYDPAMGDLHLKAKHADTLPKDYRICAACCELALRLAGSRT